jgi:serine protease Do
MQLSNTQYKQLVVVAAVAIFSSLVSVFSYRYIEQRNYWSGEAANYAKYANYYDAVYSGRAQKYFQSSSPTNFIKGAAITAPTVVNIKVLETSSIKNFQGDLNTSTGSGVIISPDGYIVTNNHVIDEGNEIEVSLNDRRKFMAKVIGTDPSTDLALIKIETQNLPAIIFGNSDSLQVGEWVLAVGNPFDLNSTVTAGIVSAKSRNINILDNSASIESFIQTDAAVNPGNSGGALVNTNGELVGINTAIITRTGQYEGYSFAIPSNLVQKVIRDIREFGMVQRGFLGISIDNISDEMAKELSLSSLDGVYVRTVTGGGAGEEAGLTIGDIITSINGTVVKSMPEMQELVGRLRPGNTLEIEYWHKGVKNKTKVTLRNSSNATSTTTSKSDKILRRLGVELRELSQTQVKRIGHGGAMVNSVIKESIIGSSNMEPGFVITKINTSKIENIQDAIQALEKADGKVVVEGLYEGYEGLYYYTFRM